MSYALPLLIAILLLALNGFFVAAEFALVASKAHRLEDEAESGDLSSRAAARASRQLSLTLAGAQLGITLCSLGLGAIAEPAIAHLLYPIFHAVGMGSHASHAVAFVISLMIVVFLHMVVGEMAPKGWAITHPERSARLLALPFAAFNYLAKPLLVALNGTSNAILRLFKIQPANEVANVHGPDELRLLLEQSRSLGTLSDSEHTMLSRMLRLQRTTVADVMIPRNKVISVPLRATDREIEQKAHETGRSRLAVINQDDSIVGLVHVRDAVRSSTHRQNKTAEQLLSDVHVVRSDETIAAAVESMRAHRSQLALVKNDQVQLGVVALEDLLEEVLGQFEDETDWGLRHKR